MKVCKKCGEAKPLSEYYTRDRGLYLKSTCKSCDAIKAKQRYLENKDHIRDVQHQWYKQQRLASHNNWEQYFKNRVGRGRKKYKISVAECLDLLEKQNYRCALSNEPLTCIVGSYNEHPVTNASLDRINPGGEYNKENVRLVCAQVNYMRLNQSDADLYKWCCLIKENLDALYEEREERLPSGKSLGSST